MQKDKDRAKANKVVNKYGLEICPHIDESAFKQMGIKTLEASRALVSFGIKWQEHNLTFIKSNLGKIQTKAKIKELKSELKQIDKQLNEMKKNKFKVTGEVFKFYPINLSYSLKYASKQFAILVDGSPFAFTLEKYSKGSNNFNLIDNIKEGDIVEVEFIVKCSMWNGEYKAKLLPLSVEAVETAEKSKAKQKASS